MIEKELSYLDKWWTHLSVETKNAVSGGLPYPANTNWWLTLSDPDKEALYAQYGGRNAHVHHTRPKGMHSYT